MSATDFKCFAWSGKSRRIRNWAHSIQAFVSLFCLFFFFRFLTLFCMFYTNSWGKWWLFSNMEAGLNSREDPADRLAVRLLLSASLSLSVPASSHPVPVTASQPGTFHSRLGIPLWEAGGSRLLCSRFLLISLLPSLFQCLWQCGRVPQPTIPRHSMCSMAGWEEAHPPLRGW